MNLPTIMNVEIFQYAVTVIVAFLLCIKYCDAYTENRPFAELNKRYCSKCGPIFIKVSIIILGVAHISENLIILLRRANSLLINRIS